MAKKPEQSVPDLVQAVLSFPRITLSFTLTKKTLEVTMPLSLASYVVAKELEQRVLDSAYIN